MRGKEKYILRLLLLVIVLSFYTTWLKEYNRRTAITPYLAALFELKQLQDAGNQDDARVLLDKKFKMYVVSFSHTDEGILAFPFSPRKYKDLMKEIEEYIEKEGRGQSRMALP